MELLERVLEEILAIKEEVLHMPRSLRQSWIKSEAKSS